MLVVGLIDRLKGEFTFMSVPTSLLDDLRQMPADRPVTLLMRHSIRYPITDWATGDSIGLTPEGFRIAEQFGAVLGESRQPGRLLSSPVGRCLDTARSIVNGAGWTGDIQTHPKLYHPFVEPVWQLLDGHNNGHSIPQPIFELHDLVTCHQHTEPVVDLLVTHDSVLGSMIAYLLGLPVFGKEHWPGFLEAVFFWKEAGSTVMVWRGQRFALAGDLFSLN